jgi:acetyl esterase/lipase
MKRSIYFFCFGIGSILFGCQANCSQIRFPDPTASEFNLPFPAGDRYELSQSYCNPLGGHRNRIAYDFSMPIGASIVAARGGTVVETVSHYVDGDLRRGHNNRVLIRHEDESVAWCGHLQRDSVLVREGEVVVQGQPIGASGNTGNTGNLPHLHFEVFRSKAYEYSDAIPVSFRNAIGPRNDQEGLIQGKRYEAGLEEIFDLDYYSGAGTDPEKHKLNLFLPAGEKPFPILLWIHGGAWAVGDRSKESDIGRRFAEQGVGVAAMSYRLSPGSWIDPKYSDQGVEHPAHIIDVARAFAWLHGHSEKYGYDPGKIFVGGYSAGGQLSALLATDARYLKVEGLELKDIRAAIPVAGGYDMESYYRTMVEKLGQADADAHVLGVFGRGEENLRQASPTSHLAASRVPMLVISETDTYDYTLIFEQLAEKLGRKDVEFLHVRDRDHAGLRKSLGETADGTRDRIVEYIHRICATASETAPPGK